VTLRMELWVEGPTDARTARRDGRPEEREPAEGGALVPLVRKALARAPGMTEAALDEALPVERIVAHRLQSRIRGEVKLDDGERRRKLSIKGWKVLSAIQKSRRRSPETLIVAVWDRDREDAPLRDRETILDALRVHGTSGAAVGICVEELEAWLLADSGAFRRAFGRGPASGLSRSPESEHDPKTMLEAVLSSYPGVEDRARAYGQIAKSVDIEVLIRCCPRGFGAFVDALGEFIAPDLRARR
jgi:hypothetical protein